MRKNERVSLEKLIHEASLYDAPVTEKQKDILTAAERLFSEQGFSDTATAQIAKQAGVTEKTLFKHFPTKADLLRRVMFPLILRFFVPMQIKHMKTLIKKANHSPEEIIKTIFHDRLKTISQHHGKIKLVMGELLKNESLRQQVAEIWHDQLWVEITQLIDILKKEGRLRKNLKTAAIARAIVSMIVSYMLSSQLIKNNWNHDDELEQMTEILLRGIAP